MARIWSRSSGVSSWPCTETACSAAARTTSSAVPVMVNEQFDSLGNILQSATLRMATSEARHLRAFEVTPTAPAGQWSLRRSPVELGLNGVRRDVCPAQYLTGSGQVLPDPVRCHSE